MSDDLLAPVPEGVGAPPPAAQPQPTAPNHDRGVKGWAASGSDAENRANMLLSGEVEGTARHPFQVIDRDQYMSMIKPYGSIARRTVGAPTARVNISAVSAIQETINRERLLAHLRDPTMNPEGARAPGHGMVIDRPVVVKLGGRLYLHDGHHRMTAAHLRGQTQAVVRLVDLDAG